MCSSDLGSLKVGGLYHGSSPIVDTARALQKSTYRVAMTTPKIYSERLREIRRAQGMTLKQVEIKSRGRWKGVVVGSYERGTRTLSIEKAVALCEFYGVPPQALFGEETQSNTVNSILPPIDLRSLQRLSNSRDPFSVALKRLADSVLLARGDWNGELISIRSSDWQTLALILGVTFNSIESSLENRKLALKIKG